MFESLSDRLTQTLRKISGQNRLTEDNIKGSLDEVRTALLEADVALSVVTQFITDLRSKAVGQEINTALRPGEAFVKIVHTELVQLLGSTTEPINLHAAPPVVILLAGLQGAGKTTTAAKLANMIQEQHKKSVLLVSTDVYRPAAMEQLETLAQQINAAFYPSTLEQTPTQITTQALEQAKRQFIDVVIIDTAGRLHVDANMMQEIQQLHALCIPTETLFVVDSMTGQDAANTAKAFNDALPLTGVILSKIDGDARGGAALSVRYLTGKPIKYIGTGEKISGFEVFHPDRIASRILGMGDILSLVEEAERKIDQKKAKQFAKKLHAGADFTFEDFRTQLQQMRSMGGMSSLLTKIPGLSGLPSNVSNKLPDERSFTKMEAIINSMTLQERCFPDLINKGSRKRRIAQGSGTQPQDINKLMKQFTQMQKMMKKFKGGGMAKMMQRLQGVLPKDLL